MARHISPTYASVVAKVSIGGSGFVMAVAMTTSYGTQAEWLRSYGVVALFAYAIPLTVDVLAVMSNLALKLPGRPGFSKVGLWLILLVTLGVSFWWNLSAGKNFIDASAHGWVVVAYLMAEYIVNWVLRYWHVLREEIAVAKAAEQAAATELRASDAMSPDLPEAQVSPAAPGNTRGEYGPRDPERGYAPSTVRAKKAAARKVAVSAE